MSNIHYLSDLPPVRDAEVGNIYRLQVNGQEPQRTKIIDLIFPGFYWGSVLLLIIVVQIVCFVITLYIDSSKLEPTTDILINFGALYGPLIQHGAVWRLVTAMFLHVSVWHILLNLFFQLRVGFSLEKAFGQPNFLMIYFLSGIGGNLLSTALAPCKIAAGASTSGFGLIGVNMTEIFLSWDTLINRNEVIASILLFLLTTIMFATMPGSSVDWRGHLGGFIVGVCLTLILTKGGSTSNNTLAAQLTKRMVAMGTLVTLFVSCTAVIFLIPMEGQHGRCTFSKLIRQTDRLLFSPLHIP